MPVITRTLAPHDSAGLAQALTILERASEGRADFSIEIERLSYASQLDIVVAERFRQTRGEFVQVSGFAFAGGVISCAIANSGTAVNQRIPTTENPPVTLVAGTSVSANVRIDTIGGQIRFSNVSGLKVRTTVAGTAIIADINQIDVDLTSNAIHVTFSL